MSPDKQRIAIAEACGWKLGTYYTHSNISPGESKYSCERDLMEGVPDYLNDLNAMHEAEKVLTEEQRNKYSDELYSLAQKEAAEAGRWRYLSMTATQRAEAFLRTIGKWEEGK